MMIPSLLVEPLAYIVAEKMDFGKAFDKREHQGYNKSEPRWRN
jgi:hypothetical protein